MKQWVEILFFSVIHYIAQLFEELTTNIYFYNILVWFNKKVDKFFGLAFVYGKSSIIAFNIFGAMFEEYFPVYNTCSSSNGSYPHYSFFKHSLIQNPYDLIIDRRYEVVDGDTFMRETRKVFVHRGIVYIMG